jgi:hypothetical protein
VAPLIPGGSRKWKPLYPVLGRVVGFVFVLIIQSEGGWSSGGALGPLGQVEIDLARSSQSRCS